VILACKEKVGGGEKGGGWRKREEKGRRENYE
jgi:hypothetical protein